MRPKRRLAPLLFALLGLTLTSATIAADSFAIIGMPLTPVSVAGVARRTVRRSAVYGGYY